MYRRVPDTTKIHELTGWRAEIALDRILDDVISEKGQGSSRAISE